MGILGWIRSIFMNKVEDEVERQVDRQVDRAVDKATDKIVDSQLNKYEAQNGGSSKGYGKERLSAYHLPEKYNYFPVFPQAQDEAQEKNTAAYDRYTMYFSNPQDKLIDAYRKAIMEEGWEQMTDVRYEKGRKYIIIDLSSGKLNLVFHIKK